MPSLDHADHDHAHDHRDNDDHGHDHDHDAPALAAKPANKPKYWRSLNELEHTPEFAFALANEFKSENASVLDDVSRRRFLQLMGASVALAGVAGCWKEDKIISDAKLPADRIPGLPQYFATSRELNGSAIGLLVKCIDGRPIKVEGNPLHPANGDGKRVGTVDVFALASILELYDPERSRSVTKKEGEKRTAQKWADFDAAAKALFAGLRDKKGAGLRFLSEATCSPTTMRIKDKLLKALPEAGWTEYEPISDDNVREGSKLAFGTVVRTQYKFDQADLVLGLDGDPLTQHPNSLRHAADFALKRRLPESITAKGHGEHAEGHDAEKKDEKEEAKHNVVNISRVYAVESTFSTLGAVSDHRWALRSEQIKPFLIALSAKVAELSQGKIKLDVPAKFDGFLSDDKKNSRGWSPKQFVDALARDLIANAGKSIVYVGQRQPAEVHALAHQLNAALGNVGKTLAYTADVTPDRPTHASAIKSLVDDMKNGKVDTLVILGGNPVYNAPADLDFAAALAKVPNSIRLGLHEDETSALCAWHVPQAHYFEAWGDTRSWDGTVAPVQPLIAPLYDGKSALELLAFISEGDWKAADELVRETFKPLLGAGTDLAWRKSLHDGIVANTALKAATPKLQEIKVAEPAARAYKSELAANELEGVFLADTKIWDGRFANNAWLQELPDYITKICWDNAALFSMKTAESLGIKNEQIVTLNVGGKTLDCAVYILPGQAQGSVGLILGYGRTAAGSVGGNGADVAVGFNTYKLRTADAPDLVTGISVAGTGKDYKFALTVDHHLIDNAGMKSREERLQWLAREGTLSEYEREPFFAKHRVHVPELKSLWQEYEFDGHRWGLAVDLHQCIGCNACMTACQSENNVPVVGKDQVLRGREMHWMRLDRYYKGEIEEPEMVTQPVMCQQCENAPCEQVCPVGATMHSKEGLNDMVYNRCIGTRYCMNNCPFKVRRFNWLDWNKNLYDPKNESLKLSKNPDVTVRMRGIMEKCNYCVQRIQAVKIQTKNAGQPIVDGMIVPACAQACPTQTITFGDLNPKMTDGKESAVLRLHKDDRSYKMLEELNVKPRTAYLARVRNYNPELVSEKSDEHGHH